MGSSEALCKALLTLLLTANLSFGAERVKRQDPPSPDEPTLSPDPPPPPPDVPPPDPSTPPLDNPPLDPNKPFAPPFNPGPPITPADYSYVLTAGNGPNSWGTSQPKCAGKAQSPVELSDVPLVEVSYPPLKWEGHWEVRESGFILANIYQGVQVQFVGEAPPRLRGGPLPSDYFLSHVNFYWGNEMGSLHSIDNHYYGMEAHMVHYKRIYGSYVNASEKMEGLAIVAVFFTASLKNNMGMATLALGLSGIRSPGSSIPIYGNAMMWLKNFKHLDHYYSYSGSLPHPPCTELVTYIVMENPGTIGIKQLREFQKVKTPEGPLIQNRRARQLRNGRQIFHCSYSGAAEQSPNVKLILLCAIHIIAVFFTSQNK